MTKRRSQKAGAKRRSWGLADGLRGLFLLAYLLLAALVIQLMYQNNFLAFRGLNHLLSGVLLVIALVSLYLTVKRRAPKVTMSLLLVMTCFVGALFAGFHSVASIGKNMNKTASYSEIKMSIVVAKDSSLSSIDQVTSVLAPVSTDKSNIKSLMTHLAKEKNLNPSLAEVTSYQTAYESVLANTDQAMVLNSSYSSVLELSYDKYTDKLKTLYTYTIKVKNTNTATAVEGDAFNIYISGIDTFGSISSVSRSDVNIILTVNTKTHKVLLTTTPRDYYVTIPDGGANQKDKLTHAGIYGVETSEKTLEQLYGITINYYARMNFTSFLKLIDLVGGITVYNDQEFTSEYGNYHFAVGNVTLDSDQALAFVRERHGLAGGDNDRGKNQEKVISALIHQLSSLKSISNYQSIANGIQDSIQTNMPMATLMTLANDQLDSGKGYTVSSQAVTGTGSTGELPSYAMPGASLYMMAPDQASVDQAKANIQAVMEGK
ncbi:LCP family glycopolymer transferase CpsA [Streptococcus sp. DD12]|uniref:LCP family glycopolymer transferase CpsA n=1 Tax=Streptococcus sp. DD12 TaxID=1777880 RepID=UPI0007939600|nr:LCP family protein [Streptococcus sp. DD12]KXT76956.1 Exopolysaccharide biosynthesis transcriptional activator EpsA [Streptococcus sp. DD12]